LVCSAIELITFTTAPISSLLVDRRASVSLVPVASRTALSAT